MNNSLIAIGLAVVGALWCGGPAYAESRKVPLIHTTDLFHPPEDPDDHLDLATVFALDEFDLRAVLIDRALGSPRSTGNPVREPGFIPVAQLCYITGKAVPVAAGPVNPLKSPGDAATDRPRREQAAIELLLRALDESPQPVVVSVLGSARIVAAAWNRNPALLKKKIKSVVVNAGTAGKGSEYNVTIDPASYVALFRSGLPVDWYPCGDAGPSRSDAFNSGARNTYWRVAHRDLFRDLPQPLMAWFVHAFTSNGRGDILRALREQGAGASAVMVLAGDRNMWSTASLVLAAGRVLAKTPAGWRFLPAAQAASVQAMSLEPVAVTIDDKGRTTWKPAPGGSHIRLFRREPGPEHGAAMTEALNALLRSIPLDGTGAGDNL